MLLSGLPRPLKLDEVRALIRSYNVFTVDEEDTILALMQLVQTAGGIMDFKKRKELKDAQCQVNS